MAAELSLVWIDLELTGLDYAKDTIVEIAVVLSNKRLSIIKDGPNLVLKKDPADLSEWCLNTFAENGLLKEMQESTLTIPEVEDQVMEFIETHIPEKGTGHLAGSSVHVDRIFLLKEMPRVVNYLNHRIVDVSSFLVMGWSWLPTVMRKYQGALKYKAKTDGENDEGDLKEPVAAQRPADAARPQRVVPKHEADAMRLHALICGDDGLEEPRTEPPQESLANDDSPALANDDRPALANDDRPALAKITEGEKQSESAADSVAHDKTAHRAMDDIHASIELLRFIKTHLFVDWRTLAVEEAREQTQHQNQKRKAIKRR